MTTQPITDSDNARLDLITDLGLQVLSLTHRAMKAERTLRSLRDLLVLGTPGRSALLEVLDG